MSFEIPARAKAELEANPALAGAALRDEAMGRVYDAADPAVKSDMRRALRKVACDFEEFTSDLVWEEMILRPAEPRVLGPLMKWAQSEGLCAHTERTVLSALPQNHRRPIRVWRSLVYGQTYAPPEPVDPAETWPRVSPGYGFICTECKCPVDEYVRGNHDPACSHIFSNDSLVSGAEAFATFKKEE